MRFSSRVLVALLLLLSVGVILTGVLVIETRREVRVDERLGATLDPAIRDIERVGRRYVSVQNNVRGFLLTGEQSFLDDVDRLHGEIDGINGQLRHELGEVLPAANELLDALEAADARWLREAVDVEIDLKRQGSDAELIELVRSGAPNELFVAVQEGWVAVRTLIDAELADVRGDRTDSLRDVTRLAVLAVSLGAIAALVSVLWLRRTLLKPLAELSEASRRLLSGDLVTPVGPVDVEEFAELAGAFEMMRCQMDAVITNRTRASTAIALEAAMNNVAQDLHDDPIQAMTAALMRVHRLRHIVDEQVIGVVDDAEAAISEAVQRLRRFTFALHPTGLQSRGLADTLRQMIQLEAGPDPGVELVVTGDDAEPCPSEIALVAFRVTREAVLNALHHASAHRIEVCVDIADGSLAITVNDDGFGFEPEPELPGHRGLSSMRQLITAADGQLTVTTAIGHGTRVDLRIPLTAPAGTASPSLLATASP